jgi:hypothetical protein
VSVYDQLRDYIFERYQFTAQSCWIAHVLSDHGLTKRVAANRRNGASRTKPCPTSKRPAIEAALRHFKMIPAN